MTAPIKFPPLPACLFNLKWRDGAYYVDKSNIDSATCYGEDELHAYATAAVELYAANQKPPSEWLPIESAPKSGKTMFVVQGFNVTNPNAFVRDYTSDPYCVWPGANGGWERWPHTFPPTHWMPLPAAPVTGEPE